MFRIERTDDTTFTLVSDDANAENYAMGEGIAGALPNLLARFEDTPVDDDGLLKFPVYREDWEGLVDALEIMESEGVAVETAIEQVEKAVKS